MKRKKYSALGAEFEDDDGPQSPAKLTSGAVHPLRLSLLRLTMCFVRHQDRQVRSRPPQCHCRLSSRVDHPVCPLHRSPRSRSLSRSRSHSRSRSARQQPHRPPACNPSLCNGSRPLRARPRRRPRWRHPSPCRLALPSSTSSPLTRQHLQVTLVPVPYLVCILTRACSEARWSRRSASAGAVQRICGARSNCPRGRN